MRRCAPSTLFEFFFLCSLLTTKVHNYHLFFCYLLGSGNNVRLKSLGSGDRIWCQTRARAGSHVWCQTTTHGSDMVEDPSMGLLRLLDPGRESGIAHRPLALESGMAVKLKRLKTFSILLIIFTFKK